MIDVILKSGRILLQLRQRELKRKKNLPRMTRNLGCQMPTLKPTLEEVFTALMLQTVASSFETSTLSYKLPKLSQAPLYTSFPSLAISYLNYPFMSLSLNLNHRNPVLVTFATPITGRMSGPQ